jgi:hypothetical protein
MVTAIGGAADVRASRQRRRLGERKNRVSTLVEFLGLQPVQASSLRTAPTLEEINVLDMPLPLDEGGTQSELRVGAATATATAS